MKHYFLLLVLIVPQDILWSQFNNEINEIITELNIDKNSIESHLVTQNLNPLNSNELVTVIPIIEEQIDNSFTSYNCFIIISSLYNGQILYKLFEPSISTGWFSDAVILNRIFIDTNTVQLSNSRFAFGIVTEYSNKSRYNPFEKTELSLFTVESDSINKILHNYTTKIKAGERGNVVCDYQFHYETKQLMKVEQLTSDYPNINIVYKEIRAYSEYGKDDDCQEEREEKITKQILMFKNGRYQK